jgi:hypothetical protein
MDLAGQSARGEDRGFAAEFADRVFDLKILDPAMGSGHFLTSAIDYLAREIIDAQERQAEQQGIESIDQSRDINWARRQVAQRCIYGVDLNPLAVELAKVSLWLRTLAAEQPLAFLDHHLKTGNSLIGSDIEDVLDNSESATEDGQLTLQQSFARTRQKALEHVMDRFQDLLSIDNESLGDVKEMEAAFEDVRDDLLYQNLLAMANVHTAEAFGVNIPEDAYKQMAEGLRDNTWEEIEGQDWFKNAEAMANEKNFFHWQLEFPVAFYDGDGNRRNDSGFDVIIGNPPYIATEQLAKTHREYLTDTFENVLHRKYDTSVAFLQQSFRLCRSGEGFVGMITPVAWETGENYKRFRNYNFVSGDIGLRTIINLPFDAFEDAYVDTNIAIFTPKNECKEFSAREFEKRLDIKSSDQLGKGNVNIPIEYLSSDPGYKIYFDKEYYELLQRFDQDQFGRLGDYTDACQGIVASFYDYADTKQSDAYLPYREADVYRYEFTPTEEKYIDFSEEDSLQKYYTQPRILVRRLVNRDDRLMATYVKDDFVSKKDLNPFIKETKEYSLKYFLASINSTLHSYLYIKSSALATKDDFRQTTLAELRALPIRKIPFDVNKNSQTTSVEKYVEQYNNWTEQNGSKPTPPESPVACHEVVCEMVDSMIELCDRRNKFNLDLLGYLSNYKEGSALPGVGLFQPAESNILDATTEERENLRVGEVKTERNGSRISIQATARYKPENKEEYETDQWGYTETEYHDGFTLTDLTDTEAVLIEAFVPIAVNEGDGFAGFRDNATKNNSLLDRLKAIKLPDPNDVADDLQRYIEVKEQTEELDEKIEKTDRVIDEIIYDLYDLTDEEIRTIESTLADD